MAAWHPSEPWSTSRPSVSHLNPEPLFRQPSADKSTRTRVPSTPATYSTPHDAILSELQGPSPGAARSISDQPLVEAPLSSDVESTMTRDDNKLRSRSDLNLLTPTPSVYGGTSPRSGINPQELLHDPFDGNILGVLTPTPIHSAEDPLRQEGPSSHSQVNLATGGLVEGGVGDGAATSGVTSPAIQTHSGGGEAVWSHLTRILDLQTQISKQHIEMEGIGSWKASEAKKPRLSHKGATPMTATFPSEQPLLPPGLGRRKRTVSGVTIGSLDDDQDGDQRRGTSEEAEKTRAREEEFAKLASQFEGRKEAINDIMSSLDDLSKALSEFHALQPPQMELQQNSRQNSLAYTSPPSTMTPFGTDIDNKRSGQGPAQPSGRPQYDWSNTHQPAPSQLTVPLSRTRSNSATTAAPAARTAPQKKLVPTLVISPVENPKGISDSPASTIGSLKLPPED